MGDFSMKVDLKGLDLSDKKLRKNLGIGMNKSMIALIGGMKKQFAGQRMQHATGGILGSIRGKKLGKLSFKVFPSKVYSGWLEEGSRSPHAPKSHTKSAFKGYHLVEKTAKKYAPKITKLLSNWIRRTWK